MNIPAPAEIGGRYCGYLPGHGALCFTHIDNDQRLTNHKITREIAEMLTPRGYVLTDVTGRWEAYLPCDRIGPNLLENFHGIFKYHTSERGIMFWKQCNDWEDRWEPLRNEAWRASLTWFLSHEGLLQSRTPPLAFKNGEANNG
jgi:hypothetical protein